MQSGEKGWGEGRGREGERVGLQSWWVGERERVICRREERRERGEIVLDGTRKMIMNRFANFVCTGHFSVK